MGVIWQVAISNAALVAAGTPLVWLIGRYAKRPALTHGLAVILLLKLITPPLWRVPLSLPEEPAAAPVAAHVDPVANQVAAEYHAGAKANDAQISSDSLIVGPSSVPLDLPHVSIAPTPPAPTPPAPAVAKFDFDRWCRRAIFVFGWVWVAGSALCAIVAAVRVILFTRALRFATRAGDVQPRADMLARRLGLRHSPAVWFVPAHVPPMLWSLGRHPKLLLPRGLWARLDIPGRDTILLHELAHWRRGDPVVRWIELLATCLYWWHPACWWARRELREAEEQCCDAWVLWAMPGIFKNYANALLEAVEYASIAADRPSARRAVPALASRMGQFVHLRRRLTMLKHGNIARALSWGGLAGVMTLGSLVLPVAPTWAQQQPTPEDPNVIQDEATPRPETTPAPAPDQDARLQLERARESVSAAELAQARQQIALLQKQLEEAMARLRNLEDRARRLPAGPSWRAYIRPAPPAGIAQQVAPAPPVAPVPGAMPAAPQPNPYWRAEPGAGGPMMVQPAPPPVTINPGAAPEMLGAPGVHNGQYRVVITDPRTGRIREIQTRELPPGLDANRVSQAERLDMLERQLQMMMDEIAKMRQATAAPQPTPAPDSFAPAQR